MMHPVFRLAASHPRLLAEHAAGYAELLAEEVAVVGRHVKQRAVLQVVGAIGLGVGLLLGGVALMLWAALPAGSMRMPWLLVVTPLLPAAPGLVALLKAQSLEAPPAFTVLRAQLAADAELLRASEPS